MSGLAEEIQGLVPRSPCSKKGVGLKPQVCNKSLCCCGLSVVDFVVPGV